MAFARRELAQGNRHPVTFYPNREAGRALAVEYGGGPDVMLLFTDAEEVGAVGAEAFLASGGLDPKRTMVLNFDARGTGGPCALIETAGDEGRLVRAIARSGAPVAAASLRSLSARASR